MAFIPLKPIPIKDRNSMIFIGMGRIDVKDNAFVVIDEVNGERMHIPVGSLDRQVRIACREKFRTDKILKRLIPLIEEVLAAGEISPPPPPADAQPPAIPEPISIGDIGHRSQ
ncbi:CRISPR-associated endonuclease Cas1 [Xenorhabdus kozodoii]|uniref:CRISPR-associated endonuclease Cas1 n=1 Tax=Xenorhabdus kozodoii TaxID=351676 RepID=A0A2D0L1W3_9GAMM|nr:CRISPR-associated endonuclease Cas1 [Xenorhabdus kozodoii]